MTDRERVVEMADQCRRAGHPDVSFRNPCVPCILRLIERVRAEYETPPSPPLITRYVHAPA